MEPLAWHWSHWPGRLVNRVRRRVRVPARCRQGSRGRCCWGRRRRSRPWEREFKLPWREAGPPNHHDDKVDSDLHDFELELLLEREVGHGVARVLPVICRLGIRQRHQRLDGALLHMCQTYIRYISDIYQTYIRHISDIYQTYIKTSEAYMSGRDMAYIMTYTRCKRFPSRLPSWSRPVTPAAGSTAPAHIPDIYQIYIRHTSDIYPTYVRHISRRLRHIYQDVIWHTSDVYAVHRRRGLAPGDSASER